MAKKATTPKPHVRTSIRKPGRHVKKDDMGRIKALFLQTYATCANVRASCLAAGVDRRTIQRWVKEDAEFAAQYEEAQEDSNDIIRMEVHRRAIEGQEKPVVSMGRAVLVKDEKGKEVPLMTREPSDNLLMFLARSRMMEFRDKSTAAVQPLPKEYVGFDPHQDGSERE